MARTNHGSSFGNGGGTHLSWRCGCPLWPNQEGKTKWTEELFNRQSVVSVTNDNFSWRSHETKKHALAFFVFNERLVVRAWILYSEPWEGFIYVFLILCLWLLVWYDTEFVFLNHIVCMVSQQFGFYKFDLLIWILIFRDCTDISFPD